MPNTASNLGVCIAATLLMLSACAQPRWKKPETIAPTPATAVGAVEGHPVVSMPFQVPGQTTWLTPLAMQSAKGLFEEKDPYAGGVASVASRSLFRDQNSPVEMDVVSSRKTPSSLVPWNTGADVRWHNVIAKGADGKEWLILNQRGVIGRWSKFGSVVRGESNSMECKGLLFIAVIGDTNGDQSLSSLDARVAIATDADARNPRQISPDDAQVWSTSYDADSESVFLEVVKDSNHDGRFGYDDDVMPYVWKCGSASPAVPVVSEAILKRALDLLK